ncbi:MAG: hypothetical protein AUI14_09615 [Actinobacteria bacterium 13_2_20CM_2_71_6]|nr:MAG: hypothetical protein AUI14_09615 [Actinobacteria bacterium 13_2_20CM_2_71_6]
MDWNLRHCSRKGHTTYAPREAGLRTRLHAQTPLGEAWRCLRCGDYVLGPAKGEGPADEAPEVLRGRALRDAVILRLLAVERGVRALLILAAAYGIWRFRAHLDAVQRAFNEDLPLLRPLAEKLHFNLDDSGIMHTLRSVIEARTSTLAAVAIGLLVYGILQLVEAVGLWLLKRWGEYFAVVATSLGIPIEIYELIEKITVVRVGALVLNIAAVIYLLVSKRLFGIRGGKAAHEAARHEASLLEVEEAGEVPEGSPQREPVP